MNIMNLQPGDINHLRSSFLVQLDGHQGRSSLLVDARVTTLPEEVGASRPPDQRLPRLVAFQGTRTFTDHKKVKCAILLLEFRRGAHFPS